jgi:hypothetical protein
LEEDLDMAHQHVFSSTTASTVVTTTMRQVEETMQHIQIATTMRQVEETMQHIQTATTMRQVEETMQHIQTATTTVNINHSGIDSPWSLYVFSG